MQLKKLFQNIGLVILINALFKPVWFVIENMVQNRIGHDAYGTYSALYSFGLLFLSLSDLGITYFLTREVAYDNSLYKKYTSALLPLKVLVSVLYPIVITIWGYFIGYSGSELLILLCASASHSFINLLTFYRAQFQAFQLFNTDTLFSILDKLLLVCFTLLLMYTGNLTLLNFVYARLLSSLVSVLIAFAVSDRLLGRLQFKIDTTLVKDILVKSLPFALIGILYSFNDKVDQVILERMGGSEITGLYAAAYRWVDIVMMYLWTVLPILFARFARIKDSTDDLRKTFVAGQVFTAVPVICISVFIMLNSDKLFFLFTNSTATEFETMSALLRILFLSVLVNGIFSIYSTLLNATGSEKQVSILILISVLVNIVVNVLYIPTYGAYSCAWATLVSTGVLSGGYLVILLLKTPDIELMKGLGKVVLFGALFSTGYYFLHINIANWAVAAVAATVTVFPLVLITNLISIRQLKDVVNMIKG